MTQHYTIRVTGRVQGVFFRASTKEKADQLGVKGLVRNEPDGSVFIEAEAPVETLREFLNWCRQGPPRAVVNRCETMEGAVKGYSSFTIER